MSVGHLIGFFSLSFASPLFLVSATLYADNLGLPRHSLQLCHADIAIGDFPAPQGYLEISAAALTFSVPGVGTH
jgi:hypothetical protein